MQGLKKSDEIFDDMMKNNKINIDQLKVIHDQLKSDWDQETEVKIQEQLDSA